MVLRAPAPVRFIITQCVSALTRQVLSDCVEDEEVARRALSTDYVRGALDSLVTLRLHVERVEPASTVCSTEATDSADAADAECESAGAGADADADEGNRCAAEPQQQQPSPAAVACASALAEADAEAEAAQAVRHGFSDREKNAGSEKFRTTDMSLLVRAFPMAGSERTGRESRSLLFDARLSNSGFHISPAQSSRET